MKYRLINPEVFATEITNENRSMYATPTTPLQVGDFVVAFADGHQEVMHKADFLKKFKPALSMNDAKREIYVLCTEIMDKESLVDEDNAETLLAEAVDLARKLRRQFQ